MSNTNTARVAVIPASAVAKLRARVQPAPPMNATMITHSAYANVASITPARVALSPVVPTCRPTTPTSPISESGKLNRNAQWIAGHAPVCAIAASWLGPSWPAMSGWSAPAPTARSAPASRHSG